MSLSIHLQSWGGFRSLHRKACQRAGCSGSFAANFGSLRGQAKRQVMWDFHGSRKALLPEENHEVESCSHGCCLSKNYKDRSTPPGSILPVPSQSCPLDPLQKKRRVWSVLHLVLLLFRGTFGSVCLTPLGSEVR